MNKILKNLGYMSVSQDILLILFGILLLNTSFWISDIFVISIAAFFILKGIIKICKYCIAKGVSEFYSDEIFFGLGSIILGILVIAAKSFILWVFRLGLGIYILYGALEDIYISLKIKKLDVGIWLPMFILAVITAAFGLGVLLYKGLVTKLSAIVIIVYAIVDLVQNALFIKKANEIFK